VTVRALVVDDEAPARRRLRAQLAAMPEVEVVGEAGDGPAAVESIRRLAPDVVFLDVQMPGMTGFEVIEAVGAEAMPAVVFVTAYDEFAVEAFEVEAVDYLLKPFKEDRLRRALLRATSRRERKDVPEALERVLARLKPSGGHLRRLVVRSAERVVFVDLKDVLRLSAEGNYVKVHTPSGVHLVRETLASLEARLDPERFARVHRSEIVAIDAIKEVQPHFHGDAIVVLKDGQAVRLSRRYQDRLLRDTSSR